jgi:hypothetical protein
MRLVDLASVKTRALGRGLAAAILAGQETAREREVGDESEAEALAGREELFLGVALEPGVLPQFASSTRRPKLLQPRPTTDTSSGPSLLVRTARA